MNKSELIDAIADSANLSKADAGRALDGLVSAVTKALKKGDTVSLVGFGTFRNVYRKTRKGLNPQTGEKIKIKGKNVVKFNAGKKLNDAI